MTNQEAPPNAIFPPYKTNVKAVAKWLLGLLFAFTFIFSLFSSYHLINNQRAIFNVIDRHQSLLPEDKQQHANYFSLYKYQEFRLSIAQAEGKNQVLSVFNFLASLPFTVLILVIIYRVWKAISPLEVLFPPDGSNKGTSVVSPALAAGLTLVPLFNLYWMFHIFLRMEKCSQRIALLTNTTYPGPGRFYIILALVVHVLVYVLLPITVTLLLLKMFLGIGSATLGISMYAINVVIGFCSSILLFIMYWKTNSLIARLNTPKALTVNPATMGGVDISELGVAGEAD